MKQNKATPQPEAHETKQNPIIRWVNDGFPPIDLNQQVTHVKELVNDYQQQAKDIELLRDALQKLTSEVKLGKLNIRKDFELINAHANGLKALKQTEPKQ